MKILWLKSDFLHPTTKGGHIRTLEMLRCLHRRHQIHYAAFCAPGDAEGPRRSSEYASRAFPVPLRVPPQHSVRFRAQLLAGIFSEFPVAVSRFRSREMELLIARLTATGAYDRVVCDFLVPAVNMPAVDSAVLFQHNVETVIWRRRVEHASNPLERFYLERQAARMFRFESRVCRAARRVVAVSPVDARVMRELFSLERVWDVPTGVDIAYFARPPAPPPVSDLVFLGSMDWAPNIEGVLFFCRGILPLIRRRRPQTTLAIAGRLPPPEIRALAAEDPLITVTGTVPDVRPYLWGALVSVVPLRIGGGTRLKIYEAMAAGVPTVSTTVGAEGLTAESPRHLRLADAPSDFAAHCLELLEHDALRADMASAARELVRDNFSWDIAAQRFEAILAG